jgi:hypothetical protein
MNEATNVETKPEPKVINYDALEAAGHSLTQITGLVAGTITYYCEHCGALVQTYQGNQTFFHLPTGSWSREEKCLKGSAVGPKTKTLREKLDELEKESYERLRRI